MTPTDLPFTSIHRHGLVRTAVGVPLLALADPRTNVERTIALAQQAAEQGASLALFPELGLSGYALDDLLQQDALLDAVRNAIAELREATRSLDLMVIAGAPLRFGGGLYNCAVVLHAGRTLGIVPKSYLPNYREFYEKRHFTSGRTLPFEQVTLNGEHVPIGSNLLFTADGNPDFAVHVEICEDVWTPAPPSTWGALAGATVLCNLSASNITIGKADYRRNLCAVQSGRCAAAYLYTAAGLGESTTDLAWDGHGMIWENGDLLAETERFARHDQLLLADVDLERLTQERMRLSSFNDSVETYREQIAGMRRVPFAWHPQTSMTDLRRPVERYPFVPNNPALLDERCFEAYNIQVQGLAQRLASSGIDKVVIGVSGGLDSTQALLVAARAADQLGLPRTNILAWTMPGFATSERSYENAWKLMRALGVTAGEIDIRPSSRQMLADIGHPFARGEAVYDITFENVQAGERTSHLFRLANLHNAIVLGTGDLSEMALGWCTYGVGDHMSHYAVNISVPKTLIQHLIRWSILSHQYDEPTAGVLQDILDMEISPELIPADAGGAAQSTEGTIGPYALHDFALYYISRFGFRPSKVAFLAWHAWRSREERSWPAGFPEAKRGEYDLETIRTWLGVFVRRFFGSTQFKRSCIPNGPKVGSGGSLSPRGDWRAPSDSSARPWLEELERNVPKSIDDGR